MLDQIAVDRAAHNAAIVRRGYEGFARGDMAAVAKEFDPGITWHLYRPGKLGGEYKGVDQVLGFFKQLMELSGGTLRMEVLDLPASDENAAAVVRLTAQRGDRRLDSHQVHLFHVRDERVIEVWQFVDDAHASVEFWS